MGRLALCSAPLSLSTAPKGPLSWLHFPLFSCGMNGWNTEGTFPLCAVKCSVHVLTTAAYLTILLKRYFKIYLLALIMTEVVKVKSVRGDEWESGMGQG